MTEIRKENIEVSEKRLPLRFKLLAFVLAISFTFQTLHSINQHTYKTGVDNYHYLNGFAGCFPIHLSVNCSSSTCHIHY